MTDKVITRIKNIMERLDDIDDKENYKKFEVLLKELQKKKGKSKKGSCNRKLKTTKKSKTKSKSKKSKKQSKKQSKKSKSPKSKGCSQKGKKIDITFNTDQINNKGGKKIIVTNHNGSYYYYVDIDKKSINVYENTGVSNENKKNFDIHFNKHILCTDYKDVFIGDDKKNKNGYGNSVLINTKNNEYIFICRDIIKFTTKDKITKYYSPIGNSSVPYPYGTDKDGKIYLIYDLKKDKASVPVLKGKYEDVWGAYYGNTDEDANVIEKIKVKFIRKEQN